ncbi:MAG TPA: inorganic phosphate transporter, partial [Chryseolinea sp.]|nr:inorganic phosphate transporter [Chryseolinea sp.]
DYGESLFKEPKKDKEPPFWIRATLVVTCTLVSFFHGSNDGQKGVGLIMLILIGIVPTYFALNENFTPTELPDSLSRIERVVAAMDSTVLSEPDRARYGETRAINDRLKQRFSTLVNINDIPKDDRFFVRKDIMIFDRNLKDITKKPEIKISDAERKMLKDEMENVRKVTDYSPRWVILLISLSLGFGTMIGWKRIVKTVGEKIGKEHLTYAQGASAEIVAASTIGLSSHFGLPVSTTHVLSSGIAGSMVANRGVKNLQPETVRNILIAWFLTLPVVMIMAGTLFLLFRSIF